MLVRVRPIVMTLPIVVYVMGMSMSAIVLMIRAVVAMVRTAVVVLVFMVVVVVMIMIVMMVLVFKVMVMIVIVMMMYMSVIMLVLVVMMPVPVIMRMVVMVMMMVVRMHRLVNMRMGGRPFRDIRVDRADDDPQHVRLVRQIARPGAVADRFHDHRRQPFGEIVHDGRNDARPGRCRHFHRVIGLRDRQSAHHLERSRGGNRIQPVVAAHRSRAERHGGAVYIFGLQRIERKRDADDVDDRIDRADLVKVHVFNRNAVNFPFGDADFFEDSQAVSCSPFAEARAADHANDVRIMAMVRRRLVRIEDDIHFQSGDAFLVDAFPFQLERLDAYFLQLALHVRPIGAGIDQCGQRHIAANAGETIEIYDSHS